jgi:hypothetical protein
VYDAKILEWAVVLCGRTDVDSRRVAKHPRPRIESAYQEVADRFAVLPLDRNHKAVGLIDHKALCRRIGPLAGSGILELHHYTYAMRPVTNGRAS